jgi:hypothetical protein
MHAEPGPHTDKYNSDAPLDSRAPNSPTATENAEDDMFMSWEYLCRAVRAGRRSSTPLRLNDPAAGSRNGVRIDTNNTNNTILRVDKSANAFASRLMYILESSLVTVSLKTAALGEFTLTAPFPRDESGHCMGSETRGDFGGCGGTDSGARCGMMSTSVSSVFLRFFTPLAEDWRRDRPPVLSSVCDVVVLSPSS